MTDLLTPSKITSNLVFYSKINNAIATNDASVQNSKLTLITNGPTIIPSLSITNSPDNNKLSIIAEVIIGTIIGAFGVFLIIACIICYNNYLMKHREGSIGENNNQYKEVHAPADNNDTNSIELPVLRDGVHRIGNPETVRSNIKSDMDDLTTDEIYKEKKEIKIFAF